MEREKDQVNILFKMLESIPNLKILAANQKERLPIISFTISGLHYNLGVKLLNDFFGIQSRGGCSCAGTYGHYLLGIDQTKSQELSENLKNENSFEKPGWIRISVHPTTSNSEIHFICNSIKALAENYKWWAKNYQYNRKKNEFFSIND
jgi:selenocysteine lyase/cysteine desulfurase